MHFIFGLSLFSMLLEPTYQIIYVYYKYPFQAPRKKRKLLSGDKKNGVE